MAEVKWSATENRFVEPYARSQSAFENVKFRLSKSVDFSPESVYWLEPEEIPIPFQPEIYLDIDKAALENESHLSANDLCLSLIIRDKAAKRWECIETFPINDHPEHFSFAKSLTEGFAIARSLEFAALVTPVRHLEFRPGRAYKRQHIISECSFQVNDRREGARFPIRVVDASWFEQNRYPEATVWTTHWKHSDVSRPPSETLDIMVNEKYADQLQRALAGEETAGTLGNQIAAEIFAEVALVTLQAAEEYSAESSTLLGVVLDVLGVKSEKDFRLFADWIDDPTDALSHLRGYAQAALNLGKAIKRG